MVACPAGICARTECPARTYLAVLKTLQKILNDIDLRADIRKLRPLDPEMVQHLPAAVVSRRTFAAAFGFEKQRKQKARHDPAHGTLGWRRVEIARNNYPGRTICTVQLVDE